MKQQKLIATLLHVLVFLSFILPFQKCNYTGLPKTTVGTYVSNDSITQVGNKINLTDSLTQSQSNSFTKVINSDTWYDKVADFILQDKEGNFTGFGTIVMALDHYPTWFGIINAFILLITGFFILRFRERESYLLLFTIDLIGFIFFLFAKGDMWGYWVCLFFWTVMVLFDAFFLYKLKQVVSQ